MKTVSIREIHHDLRAVLERVSQGEEITILNRSRAVARICPPLPEPPPNKVKLPDFAARSKAILGDRILINPVLAEREERSW
jgi:antitoxin (DNA-binding transcriptional repressor) of toxin-antitoxin stability system